MWRSPPAIADDDDDREIERKGKRSEI